MCFFYCQTTGINSAENSILVSNVPNVVKGEQGGDHGTNRGNENRPKYTYCHKWGYIREKCFKLHGQPPCANVAQVDDP